MAKPKLTPELMDKMIRPTTPEEDRANAAAWIDAKDHRLPFAERVRYAKSTAGAAVVAELLAERNLDDPTRSSGGPVDDSVLEPTDERNLAIRAAIPREIEAALVIALKDVLERFPAAEVEEFSTCERNLRIEQGFGTYGPRLDHRELP